VRPCRAWSRGLAQQQRTARIPENAWPPSQIGCLTRHLAAHLGPLMDAGVLTASARVSKGRSGEFDAYYSLPLELALEGEGLEAHEACAALLAAAQASAVHGCGGARAGRTKGGGAVCSSLFVFAAATATAASSCRREGCEAALA
jgi:hypothetical protein